MIIRQLHYIKNISNTLIYVLLAASLCLVQGGVAVVYCAGVSIDFQGLNVPGGQTSVQTWGSNNALAQTAAPSTGSGTQNSTSLTTYSTPVVVSPAQTATQTTVSNSNSQNAAQSSFTPYNTPEHTGELVNPVNFNPLSGDQPLLPVAEPRNICRNELKKINQVQSTVIFFFYS